MSQEPIVKMGKGVYKGYALEKDLCSRDHDGYRWALRMGSDVKFAYKEADFDMLQAAGILEVSYPWADDNMMLKFLRWLKDPNRSMPERRGVTPISYPNASDEETLNRFKEVNGIK